MERKGAHTRLWRADPALSGVKENAPAGISVSSSDPPALCSIQLGKARLELSRFGRRAPLLDAGWPPLGVSGHENWVGASFWIW